MLSREIPLETGLRSSGIDNDFHIFFHNITSTNVLSHNCLYKWFTRVKFLTRSCSPTFHKPPLLYLVLFRSISGGIDMVLTALSSGRRDVKDQGQRAWSCQSQPAPAVPSLVSELFLDSALSFWDHCLLSVTSEHPTS